MENFEYHLVSRIRIEHTLSSEGDIDLLEHFHGVGSTSLLLGVEEDVALLGDRLRDHLKENRTEGLLHVRTDPDEEPVVELDAGREHCANTRTGADGDTTAVKVGEVGQTGELRIW